MLVCNVSVKKFDWRLKAETFFRAIIQHAHNQFYNLLRKFLKSGMLGRVQADEPVHVLVGPRSQEWYGYAK